MARRIVVIISQSPQNQPQRRQLEEDLATKLLFERGVDVSLIPHLEHLEAGSTGLLCLEGVKGDMAVLSWLAPAQAHAELRARGIEGRLGRTTLTRPGANGNELAPVATSSSRPPGEPSSREHAVGPQSQRFVYHLDLRLADSPDAFLDVIQQLRQESSVATVPLVLGKPPVARAKPATKAVAARPAEADEGNQVQHQVDSPATAATKDGLSAAGKSAVSLDSDEALDAHLDALLDEFDQTEW